MTRSHPLPILHFTSPHSTSLCFVHVTSLYCTSLHSTLDNFSFHFRLIIRHWAMPLGPVGSWGMRWRNRSSGHRGRRGTGCHSVIGYSREGEKDGGGIGPSPLRTRFGMGLVYLTSCDQHLRSLGRPDQEVEAPTDNHLWESYADVRDM